MHETDMSPQDERFKALLVAQRVPGAAEFSEERVRRQRKNVQAAWNSVAVSATTMELASVGLDPEANRNRDEEDAAAPLEGQGSECPAKRRKVESRRRPVGVRTRAVGAYARQSRMRRCLMW